MVIFLKILFLVCFILSISIQSFSAGYTPPLITSFSYTPVYQFKTDFNSGGSFQVNRHLFNLDFFKPFSRKNQVGFGLQYDFEKWTFNNAGGFYGASAWKEVHRPSMTVSILHSPAQNWTFMFAPSLGFSGTTFESSKESLVYGAILSISREFSPELRLGLGVGFFERIEKKSIFPFLMVNWKISDQFTLKNPFRAGPVGPAGLELVYTPNDQWAIGIGSAYRSYRFRLSDDNILPNGVGEVQFIAGFTRLSYYVNKNFKLNLTGGGLFNGKLEIEDSNGSNLGKTGYDTAPFIALTVEATF